MHSDERAIAYPVRAKSPNSALMVRKIDGRIRLFDQPVDLQENVFVDRLGAASGQLQPLDSDEMDGVAKISRQKCRRCVKVG
jgi:hypothetical protein